MAAGNLPKCLQISLSHEGGMSKDKRDPGNWTGGKVGTGILKGTKFGVAAASYPNLDIPNLTLNDVRPIYERNYWRPINGEILPAGIDLATVDFAINSGVSRSAKALQSVLGVAQDGKIGTGTVKAAILSDGKAVIKKLCGKRLSFMQSLAIWKTYKNGWSSRVADIEAKAVAMYLSRSGRLSIVDRHELESESAKATKTASAQNTGAVTAGGSGGGLVTTDINWWIVGGIIAVALIVVGILAYKAAHNKNRAKAYAAAAAS